MKKTNERINDGLNVPKLFLGSPLYPSFHKLVLRCETMNSDRTHFPPGFGSEFCFFISILFLTWGRREMGWRVGSCQVPGVSGATVRDGAITISDGTLVS